MTRRIVLPIVSWYFQVQVQGLDRVPRYGPAILAINHLSMLDPILVGAVVPRVVHFMAKEELFRYPLLGWLLRCLHAFPVRRGQADREALSRALAVLKAGGVVGIFPEGTRSADGQLLPLQGGTAFLALKSGAAVIPVAIAGTHRAMPRGALWPRRARVQIRIGEPLCPGMAGSGSVRREQLQAVSESITLALHRLVNQLFSGQPSSSSSF